MPSNDSREGMPKKSSAIPGNQSETINTLMAGLQLEKILEEREDAVPVFPDTGRFNVKIWARIMGVTVEALKKSMEKSGYKPISRGKTIVINAEKYWEAMETDSG